MEFGLRPHDRWLEDLMLELYDKGYSKKHAHKIYRFIMNYKINNDNNFTLKLLNSISKFSDDVNWISMGLENIPEILFQQNIQNLNLSWNKLTTISESIGNLENLETLYLHHNNLVSIPDSISNLKKLIVLSLGDNNIAELPDFFEDLPNLKKIEIKNLPLKTLPNSFFSLRNLERISVGGNNFSDSYARSLKKWIYESNPDAIKDFTGSFWRLKY